MTNPTVVVHFDTKGDISYLATKGACLVIVDERAPNDRVFEWLPRTSLQEVTRVLAGGQP